MTNDKNKDKKTEYDNMRLSLNIKNTKSKSKNPMSTKNISNKKNNKGNNNYNNNYGSLLTHNKQKSNNINTINNNILKSIINLDYDNKSGKNMKKSENSQNNSKAYNYNKSVSNTIEKNNKEKLKMEE